MGVAHVEPLPSETIEESLGRIKLHGYTDEELMTIFDNTSLYEMREACVQKFGSAMSSQVENWLVKRIDYFIKARNDNRTLALLLRVLFKNRTPGMSERKVVWAVHELAAYLKSSGYPAPYYKELLVILCGRFYENPTHYWQTGLPMREYCYQWLNTKLGFYSLIDNSRVLISQRILKLVGAAGAKSFL